MNSSSNRVSGRLSDYFGAPELPEDVEGDQRTKLDRTIDKIGMGSYQWTLLSLCGFGWMADNCWIQAIAIILPRVQQHYSVSDRYIGALSSSMFFGMMLGAVGWGTCSDLVGRSTAFNATLFFTALFGVLAGFAPTFFWLCVSLFFLGSAVGGSMPTDGTLLLEHMPNGKQYLLTALSVFFSLGAVLAALGGIAVIPQYSCPPTTGSEPCDVDKLNMGWKYLLILLGLLTLLMFFARVVFFRIHESPRYLVHAGRPHEAVLSLRKISEFNGDNLRIDLGDVEDHRQSALIRTQAHGLGDNGLVRRITDTQVDEISSVAQVLNNPSGNTVNYQSTDSPLFNHDATLNQVDLPSSRADVIDDDSGEMETDPLFPEHEAALPPKRHTGSIAPSSNHLTLHQVRWKLLLCLPSWAKKPLGAWLDRLALVLSKEWRATTLLVWWIWFAISLAYTMFNVYLPKLLETRSNTTAAHQKTLEETMWDIVIFTTGGCPGSLLGAYLIQSPLGRRLSLSLSTLITAAFCVLFVAVENRWAIRASTVGISLSATTMWAVLYGMTPEIFVTKVRGTACGTASALSRIGGMTAPLIGGALLVANSSFPVYASIVIFTVGGICVLPLRVSDKPGGGNRMLH